MESWKELKNNKKTIFHFISYIASLSIMTNLLELLTALLEYHKLLALSSGHIAIGGHGLSLSC